MDLIKIGKYISGKRKELGMTQRELAEKLNMSDKSVSKWERGVCLPDVSLYSELCLILGISINEFLAGEDITQENIVQKSEENIVGVASESKTKQKRLKAIIALLSVVSISIFTLIGIFVCRSNKPKNYITPVDQNSIEMETAKLLAGPDGAYIYKFNATDEFTQLKLYFSEYRSGELVSKENIGLGYIETDSPETGEILVVPDFENFVIKVVVSAEGTKTSTEIPILSDVVGREYYGRSATDISKATDIKYDEEQPLLAFIYDNDEMWVLDLLELMSGQTDSLAKNAYVYYFSFQFCK